jgi:replication initiation and membrane attachment protein DnaB
MIKTFKNNKMYHEALKNAVVAAAADSNKKQPTFKNNINPNDIRFTKVLTKYSTEYNNSIFIQDLCQQLSMDKKDLFGFFISIKNTHNDINTIYNLFENYEINKLDINRIYRYLDKYMKEDASDIVDKEIEIDADCEIGCYDDGDGEYDM